MADNEFGFIPDKIQPKKRNSAKSVSQDDSFGFIPDKIQPTKKTVSPLKENKDFTRKVFSGIYQDSDFTKGAKDSLKNVGVDIADLVPGVNLPQYHSGSGGAYEAGDIAGNIAGFLGGGEGAEALRLLGEGVPLVGKVAKALGGSGVRGVARRAIGSAGYGALTNPQNRKFGAEFGGLASVAGDIIPMGFLKGGKKLLQKLKSDSSNSLGEAAKINDTSTSPLSIFDIAGHQGGQRFLNKVIAKIPFSGVKANLQKAVSEVNNRTANLMNYFRGNYDPSEIGEAVKNKIIDNFQNKKAIDSANWTNLGNLGDQGGVRIGSRDNLKSTAEKYLENHNEAIRTGNESGLDKADIETLKKIVKGNYAPSRLSTALNSRAIYGEKAAQHYAKQNNYLGKMYTDLKDAHEKDIEQAIKRSGNNDIQSAWNDASDYHKNEIVPYNKNGIITRMMNNGINLDTIHNLLISSGSQKMLQDLEEPERRAIAYSLFQKSGKETGENQNEWFPSKIINKYDSLSPLQKKNLFTAKEKEEINNLRRLVKANHENNLALNAPATGFALKGDNVVPTILGLGGLGYFHPLYSVAAAGMLSGGRLANRLARSKALKRAYINQGRAIQYQPSVIARSAIPVTAKAAIAAISPTKKKKTIEKNRNS